jgi:hypothetical protein
VLDLAGIPVTLEADYRPPTEDMGCEDCGMSRFYDGVVSRPLDAQYDVHFVPVRDCGCRPVGWHDADVP